MPRAIWTGSLSFGLVNVPVGLFTATDDKAIHFNQFQAGTSDRVRQKRVNERTGDEVEYAEVVKGYDLGGGEYVIVTPEELESVEPGRSRTIEITDFVDLDAIDPIYYKSTYFLGPQGDQAVRPYALLREAMAESNKVAVASLVLRTKEHLVTIRPMQSVLALETMYFADEIRDPIKEIPLSQADLSFSDRELSTAKLLIDSMASTVGPRPLRGPVPQARRAADRREASGQGDRDRTPRDSSRRRSWTSWRRCRPVWRRRAPTGRAATSPSPTPGARLRASGRPSVTGRAPHRRPRCRA